MNKRKIGVLVMSYGTPESMDAIEAYYTHIRRGHPPTKEALAELTAKYEAIVGGVFPLRQHTNEQMQALERCLRQHADAYELACYQGLKHAPPFIEDGIGQMAQDGIQQGIGIVLAPHYSVMSVGEYIKRAKQKADELGIPFTFVESYHLHPKLIEALCLRVQQALQKFAGEDVMVLFSAHSLPRKILEMNDPYVDQLLATSKAIADQAGIDRWKFVWQSAGQTAVPWLGPDITEELKQLYAEGIRNVLVCPVGFVSDHLEVLYDIDIECQRLAKDLGMHLERTESLNADPLFIEALADVILQALEG